MRLKFTTNIQKQIIESFRKENNLTWAKYAELLEVNPNTLKDWWREKRLLPMNTYEKLDPYKKFEKYLVEIKNDNWGKSKGGILSTGKRKTIKKPEYSPKLAEFVGIMIGDGNIFTYRKKINLKLFSVNQVRIAGNAKDENDYIRKFVPLLCYELFGITPKIKLHNKYNAIYACMNSVELVRFLSSIGLKDGNKINNRITIPEWIWSKKEFLSACIRGLIDTDGSIYELKPNWPGLFQISFKSYNQTLLTDTRKALITLGYKVSDTSGNRIYITKKSEIEKYIKEIGFNNKKHRIRYFGIASSSSGQT